MLNIVNAFDTDKNSVITEKEFIAKFEKAGSANVGDSKVPSKDTKGLPVKDSK